MVDLPDQPRALAARIVDQPIDAPWRAIMSDLTRRKASSAAANVPMMHISAVAIGA